MQRTHYLGIRPVIYIVDDDKSVRKSLARLLKSVGWETETFASAEEFLSKRPTQSGCLVLDISLPGMSGIELQKKLAKSGNNIPIIFITAQENEQLRTKGMNAGACGFLKKPFDEQALIDAIHAVHESQSADEKQ